MDRLKKILEIEDLVTKHPVISKSHGIFFRSGFCYMSLLFNGEYNDVWIRTMSDEQLDIVLNNLHKWCI